MPEIEWNFMAYIADFQLLSFCLTGGRFLGLSL